MSKTQTNKVGFCTKEIAAVKQDSASRTISGYAAIFGNKDRDGDIILRGAFAKSIADRGPASDAKGKILFLWQHERTEPLGRITTLKEDEKGLYFEAELDEIEIADRAIKQLESGTLNQFSIGFSYINDAIKYDEEQDAFLISEVKLYEVSVVSIAANPETEFLGMKAEGENEKRSLSNMVEDVCKGLPIDKQEDIQRLVTRAMALHQPAPSETREKEAAADEVKGFFDNFTNL